MRSIVILSKIHEIKLSGNATSLGTSPPNPPMMLFLLMSVDRYLFTFGRPKFLIGLRSLCGYRKIMQSKLRIICWGEIGWDPLPVISVKTMNPLTISFSCVMWQRSSRAWLVSTSELPTFQIIFRKLKFGLYIGYREGSRSTPSVWQPFVEPYGRKEMKLALIINSWETQLISYLMLVL